MRTEIDEHRARISNLYLKANICSKARLVSRHTRMSRHSYLEVPQSVSPVFGSDNPDPAGLAVTKAYE